MVADEPADESWYAQGVRFRCTACGLCCTGEPGHVWVTPAEIRRLAKARGLSPWTFKQRYVTRARKRLTLKERPNGDCVMLHGTQCSVYGVKPLRCTTFPFWDVVLSSREEWEETARRCEGIGQGDLYSAEEIGRLLTGDCGPLVEKHGREPETPVYSRYNGELPSPPADMAGALEALEALYGELDAELPRWQFTCVASGNCCDFDAYGHRLYVSTLEAEHFFRHAPAERSNDNPRHCPAWGADRHCHARPGRMLGCRTYFCPPYPRGVPADLHARYDARIKDLHDRFGVPYAYRDIVDWAADRWPAGNRGPPVVSDT